MQPKRTLLTRSLHNALRCWPKSSILKGAWWRHIQKLSEAVPLLVGDLMIISIKSKPKCREKEKGITINFQDTNLGTQLATEYILSMIRLSHIVTIEGIEE